MVSCCFGGDHAAVAHVELMRVASPRREWAITTIRPGSRPNALSRVVGADDGHLDEDANHKIVSRDRGWAVSRNPRALCGLLVGCPFRFVQARTATPSRSWFGM